MALKNILGFIPIALLLICFSMAQEMNQAIDAEKRNAPESYDKSNKIIRAAFPQLSFLEFKGGLLAYLPKLSTVINKMRKDLPRAHPLYSVDEFESEDTVLIEARITSEDNARYFVVFTEGPSFDCSFYFVKTSTNVDKPWADIPSTALAIPGTGAVYAAGRNDNYFTKRTKYIYTTSGLRKVSQPYYYVGLKTYTLQAIKIYSDGGQLIAELPKDSDIEVLLTDDKVDSQGKLRFLVRTPFGLIGWVWFHPSQYYSNVIEGISWWGD